MLYPIAKIMKNSKRKEGLLFYDSDTGKTKYLKLQEIQNNTENYKFAGIYVTSGMVRLYKYFKDIGILGDEVQHTDSFTVCKKLISKDGTKFLLVDTLGNQSITTKEDLYQLKSSGINVAGVELQSSGRLLISSDIETVILNDDCKIEG